VLRKPVTFGGAVLAVFLAAVIATLVIIVQTLTRIVARRRGA
jgi:hypothetical protein